MFSRFLNSLNSSNLRSAQWQKLPHHLVLISLFIGSTMCYHLSHANGDTSNNTKADHDLKSLDTATIIALRETTNDIIEPEQQIETLTWLSEMSKNIEKRVPNDFYRIRLLQTVLEEANRVNLDPQLVLAVMAIESNFNRYAESGAGAQGLMQVMPFWKDELGSRDDDLFNPRVNIRYGCEILKHYIDRYSPSIPRALAAYNGSLGRSFYYEKVLKRLAKSWGFESVYSMQSSGVAINELHSRGQSD